MISAMELLKRGVRMEAMDALYKVLARFEKDTARDGWPILFVCQVKVGAIVREQEPIRWKAQKILRVRDRIRAYGPISEPFHANRRTSAY